MGWILTNAERLCGWENKLVCSFIFAVEMIKDAVWEFMNYEERQVSIPEKEVGGIWCG